VDASRDGAAAAGNGWLLRRFMLPPAIVSAIAFAKVKTSQGRFSTGRECGLASGCFVAAGAGGIELGDDVLCGPNVAIVAMNYRYAALNVPFQQQGTTSSGIRIGSNVWIGANCTILDGAAIGDNTIVVANSLVNRRFPPNVIIQGNPAKVVMRRGRANGGPDDGER
jgi:acetyltransferase-like isoleucine patch superfamily enzyme